MVRPVEFESTTTGLKGRCSTVELRTHWEQVMDLNHRSSRYERDEIDLFSNLLKTLWMGFQESQAPLKIFLKWSLHSDLN